MWIHFHDYHYFTFGIIFFFSVIFSFIIYFINSPCSDSELIRVINHWFDLNSFIIRSDVCLKFRSYTRIHIYIVILVPYKSYSQSLKSPFKNICPGSSNWCFFSSSPFRLYSPWKLHYNYIFLFSSINFHDRLFNSTLLSLLSFWFLI